MRRFTKNGVMLLLSAVLLLSTVCSLGVLPMAAGVDNVVVGGTFEETDAAVYNTNWVDVLNKGGAVVEDPLVAGNHCLKVPNVTETKKDFYLYNLNLELNTTYVFSFDVYSTGKAATFFWGAAYTTGGGQKAISGNSTWTHYSYEVTTASEWPTNVYPNFLWMIVKTNTDGSDTYFDNVSIVEKEVAAPPVTDVKNSVVSGGTFEAPAGDEVYATHWKMLNSGATLVTDPRNSANHCLKLPQEKTAEYYLKGLYLQPSTTYLVSFDVLTESKAAVYFWSNAFSGSTGVKIIAATSEWKRVTYETTTSATITENSATPDWLFGFLKNSAEYTGSDTYIDNFSIAVKPKEVPTVKQFVGGGDFEDASLCSENWTNVLKKATIVADTEKQSNHCLQLPYGTTAMGDAYPQNVWLEPNTVYFLSFDMRGGAVGLYFLPSAFEMKGMKTVDASNVWKTVTYKVVTKSDATYFSGGYQNWLIGFSKTDAGNTNLADTYIDNFRLVKAGAYVDDALQHGSITLSTWKEPDTVGTQAVTAADGTVTVTVTPDEGYLLKPDSLYYVTEDGERVPILNKESGEFGEGDGTVFRFAMPKGAAVVTAEFVPTTSQNFRFGTLGTSVYYGAGNTEPTGVRFLNRLYVENLDVTGDTVTVTYNGATHTMVEFGSLLKRTSNTDTELKLENVNDSDPSRKRVWRTIAYNGGDMRLADYTESYVDFTVAMTTANVNTAFLAREYTACGYVILKDANGKMITLYTDTISDSPAAVAERARNTQWVDSKEASWREHPQDYKLIAVTFDRPDFTDGEGKIESIVEAMYALDCSATLNVAGESLAAGSAKRDSQIALLSDAIEKGFEIGSYTWGNDSWAYSANELAARTEQELTDAIVNTQTVIRETLGVTPLFLRTPLLLKNDTVVDICRQNGLTIIGGNYHTNAYYDLETTSGATYEAMSTNAHDGALWILHAHRQTTTSEFLKVLPDLYARGYRFCTVEELVAYQGMTPVAGDYLAEVVAAY